ncbi:hypothetical protein SAMN04488522_102981 [Pedobacter caeni]|uniref:SMODS and SLOG-associating 2TM effector domain-containing protein n=2 Tax=Pedobacter caeni TaxID=288992 RepID=A0A1M5B1N9_9SPHI|nr:hypothetical protein SAMN04488522_102981 [Pedobacter caeni]
MNISEKELFDAEMEDALKADLCRLIRRMKRLERLDSTIAHSLFWLSILASFSSAILVSGKYDSTYLLAVIAGIPGLVVVIEKTFDFTQRTVWDLNFRMEFEELLDEMKYKKIAGYKAVKKFRKIIRKNEYAFQKIGFFSKTNTDRNKDNPVLTLQKTDPEGGADD